jgi:NAD(P)H-nitrite reductase large subunit
MTASLTHQPTSGAPNFAGRASPIAPGRQTAGWSEGSLTTVAIVCHCEVVRDRTIVDAIHDGARTLTEVQEACAVAAGCGGCTPTILALLAEHVEPPADDHRLQLRAESRA